MIKSLSVVFPLYNESERLSYTFQDIEKFRKKKLIKNIEYIFVDDGSKDNSYDLITKFIKDFKKKNEVVIKVIKSKNNLGKGSALKLGVKFSKYDWILTTDIDMSVSLFQICKWIEKK